MAVPKYVIARCLLKILLCLAGRRNECRSLTENSVQGSWIVPGAERTVWWMNTGERFNATIFAGLEG
jgi:hypothetical protein